MTANTRIALSSDHAAIQLRRAVANHLDSLGWEIIDVGPETPQSTHYPKHWRDLAIIIKLLAIEIC